VVYLPDKKTPVADALVLVAGAAEARTGVDGSFLLKDLPKQPLTLEISKGAWVQSLEIDASRGVDLTPSQGALPAVDGAPRIAAVTGEFDHIQSALRSIGVGKIDVFDGGSGAEGETVVGNAAELFASPAKLARYQFLLVSCGAETPTDEASVQNVRDFVAAGGNLVVTDLASSLVAAAFPNDVAWVAGGGDEEPSLDADVLATSPFAWLQSLGVVTSGGKMPVEGLASGWSVIDSVSASTQLLARAEVSYFEFDRRLNRHTATLKGRGEKTAVKPLAVMFQHGKGRVLYASFHSESGSGTAPQTRWTALMAFQL
jgi:hypothetical protein